MKRFTQYLYECRQEKRIRNVGFVKAEQKETSCRLQIQGRGLGSGADGGLKVYLFYKRGDKYESVVQTTVLKKSPIINCMLEFTKEDIGNARSVEDIAGIVLSDETGRKYAAVWNGENVNVEDIHEMTVKQEKQEEKAAEPESVSKEEEKAEALDAAEDEKAAALEAAEEKTGTVDICEKIQRKDLARLPRKDWRLANNNFLLHGFYNYHHLLWIEEGKELYIGVPGVCHAREMQAAKAFGFTKFITVSETGVSLNDEERNPGEDFGYYCRRIIRNE